METKKCCGTCKYCGHDQLYDKELLCTNIDSDNVGETVFSDDAGCNDWEEKE